MPGPFAEAADDLEQAVTDHTTEIADLQSMLGELETRVAKLEADMPKPIDPTEPTDPDAELTWINYGPDTKIQVAGVACTTECDGDRAEAFQKTDDDLNVRIHVWPGDEADVGRGRSEFRTDGYIGDSWHVEFEVVVGPSHPTEYNVHSQYHPDDMDENPSASINYQNDRFGVQTSEGTGATIKDRGYVTAHDGDRIHVVWDVKFGGNGTGQVRCQLDNLTTGEHKTVNLTGVSLGKAGRLHNFKAGSYRQVATNEYEATYYDFVISHPAQFEVA